MSSAAGSCASERPISPSEERILRLAVKGFTDKEISRQLEISMTTVRTHWTRLRAKLKVVNRAQAIAEVARRWHDADHRDRLCRYEALASALHRFGIGAAYVAGGSYEVQLDEESACHLGACGRSLNEILASMPAGERQALEQAIRTAEAGGSSACELALDGGSVAVELVRCDSGDLLLLSRRLGL